MSNKRQHDPVGGRRREVQKTPAKSAHDSPDVTLPEGSLRSRLLAAIERKLVRIEERQALELEMTAADSEREAREIGQLIRNYEKLTKLEGDTAGSGARGRNQGKGSKGDDADRWRQELAKRIERVREQWAAHGGAGEP